MPIHRPRSPESSALIHGNAEYLRQVVASVNHAIATGSATFTHESEDDEDDPGFTTVICRRENHPIGFRKDSPPTGGARLGSSHAAPGKPGKGKRAPVPVPAPAAPRKKPRSPK